MGIPGSTELRNDWRGCYFCTEKGTQKDTLLSTQTKEKDALKLSEESAEAGNVDASLMYASQAEGWKKKHDELYKQVTTPERTMTVCDVCGVFINSTDNDQRKAVTAQLPILTSHLSGDKSPLAQCDVQIAQWPDFVALQNRDAVGT